MKSFLIAFEYEGHQCECFVQKLTDQSEHLYIVNFKDNWLIRRFSAKKVLFTSNKTDQLKRYTGYPIQIAKDHLFEDHVWKAIWREDIPKKETGKWFWP